ncbi:unnamed protein product [Pararhodospirillum photometricum DSM 122]|uniref:Uncharacterized protein n=1 Tax=Pararhodospirillum photometricum DSM 122 TaxID=1150469 RepID=H6SN42_PARPM|nr:unnamed protein product [Pararhodospirillum photometricum DSM 122]
MVTPVVYELTTASVTQLAAIPLQTFKNDIQEGLFVPADGKLGDGLKYRYTSVIR